MKTVHMHHFIFREIFLKGNIFFHLFPKFLKRHFEGMPSIDKKGGIQ